jgi:hypothetical protein
VDVVNLTGEVVVGEGFSVEYHGLDSVGEADSVDFAVDFSVSVDLAGLEAEEAGDELAAPPPPLLVHLPPVDRVTSTQFF